MGGLGAVVGNRDLIGAYWQLKTNVDSGMFEALQEAAAAALRSDQSSVAEMCAIYQRRRDVLVEALRTIGLRVDPPHGAIYVWARVPTARPRPPSRSGCSRRPRW